MTDAVETMVYAKDRGVPWHKKGVPADGLMTAAEALKKGGIDWLVEAKPLFIDPPKKGEEAQLVTTHRAIVRVSDGSVLGVVGNKYVPVQNIDAMSCLDSVVDSGEAKYDTVGSLWGGRRVFISMELPKHIAVKGDDSDFLSYLVALNGHDGWTAFEVIRTTVRVVCHNTAEAARSSALAKFSARHTAGVTQRVGEIRDALQLQFKELETLNDLFNKMAGRRISEARAKEVLLKVFPLTEAQKGTAELELAKSDFAAALNNWRTTETLNDKLRGTNYGLYQAVVEYADYGINYRKDDNRVAEIMTGTGRVGDAKKRAMALLRP